MTQSGRDELARRSGLSVEYVGRLIELGIVREPGDGPPLAGDVRRVMMVRSIEEAGISLDGVASAVSSGELSFDFLDAPAYERFAAMAPESFAQVSDRTGLPLDLLMTIREAAGMPLPEPDAPLRRDEMDIVPFIEIQVNEGFARDEIERLLRVLGEATRRIAEQEGEWWNAGVIRPALAANSGAEQLSRSDLANRTTPLAEKALLGMYHAQQGRVWMANLIDGFEVMLARAGLHSRLDRPPAVCFLDITGYTRLTQERGDAAAADIAATVARLVRRSSVDYDGKPIKWLGDGVMLLFRDAHAGVVASLEMVDALASAGLPPAHVGLHAGPVLYQEGDYFGQTVNIAARIAEYARPGEVLVSGAIADAAPADGAVAFHDIGPVELKGVEGTLRLLRAARNGSN
jgi:adenylate cyclase